MTDTKNGLLKDQNKPFAPACERNQEVILEVLQDHLRPTDRRLFEIGSGTGQHAVFMAARLPQLQWLTSDRPEQHEGIQAWLDEAALDNVQSPVNYQVGLHPWPVTAVDVVLSVNTLHIMPESLVETLIKDLGNNLKAAARVLFYGPFKYQGQFTTPTNAEFDDWLKAADPQRGIRDFEWVCELMQSAGFVLMKDQAMPANNQMLIFEKT